jgi:hypothetical protein
MARTNGIDFVFCCSSWAYLLRDAKELAEKVTAR